MLFLVISTPMPAPQDEVRPARVQFRAWIKDLRGKGRVVHYYPRVGRGSVVLFDVRTNDELHNYLHRWLTIIPATFDILPLVSSLDEEDIMK